MGQEERGVYGCGGGGGVIVGIMGGKTGVTAGKWGS